MNRLLLFTELAEKVQSNKEYYVFGKPSPIGIIEKLLAYFGIEYKLKTHSEIMHQENLEILKNCIMHEATEEQLKLIFDIMKHNKSIPQPESTENIGKVFISMPMNDEKCRNVDEIREGIRNAVIESHNDVYFLNRDAYNDNMFNKMIAEIAGCKFLIADFTSQNPGVYYEAGYARALGKTVIHTCKKSDFENMHFDIKQIQCVIWNDKEDLTKNLRDQIEKSNLKGKNISGPSKN